jgi:arsenate reductase-like glutaredoxin family protein
MIQRLNFNNFFTKYIVDTNAKELTKQDKTIALIASLIIGVCTIWLVQGIVAIIRCKLDQKKITVLPMPKFHEPLKIKSKTELFNVLERDGSKVNVLDLRYSPLTENELERVVALCPNAQKIAVRSNGIAEKFLESMQTLGSLRVLDIIMTEEAKPSPKDIKNLKSSLSTARLSFQKLAIPSLSRPSLADENIQEFEEVDPQPNKPLEYCLILDETTKDELTQQISASPQLERLEFKIGELSTELADKIKNLNELNKLDIDFSVADNPKLTPKAFETLTKTPKLAELSIKIPEFTEDLAAKLRNAKELTKLHLELQKAPSLKATQSIAATPGLKKLSLDVIDWIQNQQFLISTLTYLAKSQSIENLTLKRVQTFDQRCIGVLKKMGSLEKLSLPSIRNMDFHALAKMADLPNIKKVVINHSFVLTDDHIAAIEALSLRGIEVKLKKIGIV